MHRPDFPVFRHPRRVGFTLLELLVVIAIIVVLVGILLPVAARVREQAQAADTKARIATLSAMMQAYYGDFNAYPGPLSNMQVNTNMGGLTPPDIGDGGVADSANLTEEGKVTGNENAVLGLLGGLRNMGGATPIRYETAWVGNGPGALGVTPKKLPAYGDTAAVQIRTAGGGLTGKYADENGVTCEDTEIPEFVDTFPDPLPFLILRARVGQRTVAMVADDNPVVTPGTESTRTGTYDLSQINGYVAGADPAHSIGSGKKLKPASGHTFAPSGANKIGMHGLQTVNVDGKMQPGNLASPDADYRYPFDAFPAFRSSASPKTAKQADSYILISAGIDRIYGTPDDITNFGEY